MGVLRCIYTRYVTLGMTGGLTCKWNTGDRTHFNARVMEQWMKVVMCQVERESKQMKRVNRFKVRKGVQ